MTRKSNTIEPIDERWVAHMRDLSTGVVPPTLADPHDMSRVAIRRTRTRRAVLVTGGGMAAVAAVTATAFALGGPTTQGVLLPGASVSVSTSADPSSGVSEQDPEAEALAREKERLAAVALAPDGWEVHELEGLTYALPPGIVTSGPVQDEPGVTSDMWHSEEDPDAPPFIRVAYVTPDYEFYDTDAGGLTQTPGPEATSFDLPGASVASVEDGSSEELREITGVPERDGANEHVRILVHRADGPGRYIVTMNLPEGNDELIEGFLDSLSLD